MVITVKHLEAFIWVADLASFVRAGDRLNTTQPNISNRISTLEGLIGAPLFDRTGAKVHLTPKGQQLMSPARAVLAARDQFLQAADEKELTQGTLRLGVTEIIVHAWLRAFTLALKSVFPNLAIELTIDMAAELERGLHARQLDLVLINGPFQYPAASKPLGRYPMIWVAAPSLSLTGSLRLEDLAAHPILTHTRGSWPHRLLADHFHMRSARLVPSSNLATCLHMTVDGMGVAVLPKAMASRELAEGGLMALDYHWTPDDLEFQARYQSDKAPKHVAQAASLASRVATDFAITNR
jgi:DNA-binding transcriptional LysR family regulator